MRGSKKSSMNLDQAMSNPMATPTTAARAIAHQRAKQTDGRVRHKLPGQDHAEEGLQHLGGHGQKPARHPLKPGHKLPDQQQQDGRQQPPLPALRQKNRGAFLAMSAKRTPTQIRSLPTTSLTLPSIRSSSVPFRIHGTPPWRLSRACAGAAGRCAGSP